MDEIFKQLGITPQLVLIQIIGFVILMVAFQQVFTKKIFGILDERRDNIQKVYDQLDADRAAMETARAEYEQRLHNIEAEAREKIQAAVKEAQALRDNLVFDAQKQAETILQQGRNESERERQKAFLEMRQQVVALAVAAAGKVIGENLDNPRHTKLVDDFIGTMGANGASHSLSGSNGASAA